MAIKQQAYQVMLELFNGLTGARWVDANPSISILEEITVDIYQNGSLIDTRYPNSRISDNLILFNLSGGSGGDTDASSIFLEPIYNGSDDIIISSVQILLDDFESVSVTEPSGRASNFREMIVQLYMRFFNKVTLDSDSLEVYNESGVVNTTQSVSDTGSAQTVNEA